MAHGFVWGNIQADLKVNGLKHYVNPIPCFIACLASICLNHSLVKNLHQWTYN